MKIDTSSYYPDVPSSDPEGAREDAGAVREFFPSSSSGAADTGVEHATQPAPGSQAPAEPEREPSPAERITDRIANIISWILVPLLMPVYGIMLSFGLSILDIAPLGTRVVFTLIVFAINCVIPMLLVMLLKKIGLVDDLGLNGRKERLIPYIITIVCMAGTGWFFWFKNAPDWVCMFFAGGAMAGLVNLIVNFRWKISAHAAGIAGIVALLIRIMKDGFPVHNVFVWLVVWIILAGLMGTARVWLGRHTVMQILCGYAVGFLSVFFMTMIHF